MKWSCQEIIGPLLHTAILNHLKKNLNGTGRAKIIWVENSIANVFFICPSLL